MSPKPPLLVFCFLMSLLQLADAGETLRIATRHVPPFAIKASDGSWSGLSIELWRRIADDLKLPYTLEAMGLQAMLRQLESDSIDLAVAALTVTPQREERFDFTHSFHTSGLGIAISTTATSNRSWWYSLRGFLSSQVLQLVGLLSGLVLVAALVVWRLERKHNPAHFGGAGLKGVGSALWWAFVTLTTVGYGDKAPITVGGRVVASFWMLTSVVLVSVFTGSIASTLTVSQLESGIEGPDDLHGRRVATVESSTSEVWLRERGIDPQGFAEVADALHALTENRVDAVIYDAPILRYLSTSTSTGFAVLPGFFERQSYAFGMPEGHPLREQVNRSLLKQLASAHWKVLLHGYLGD